MTRHTLSLIVALLALLTFGPAAAAALAQAPQRGRAFPLRQPPAIGPAQQAMVAIGRRRPAHQRLQ